MFGLREKRSYDGRVVVVTGAAGGLGRALARRFAREGARLALLDRDEDGAQTLAGDLRRDGAEALALVCDVTSEQDCARALAAVIDRFGGIDVLVNNAGITHRSPFRRTEAAVVRRVMEVNFFGALYCTKRALESLIARRGQIVALSSVAGFAPLDGRTGYAASKHALHGFFDTLRSELRGTGVGVLLVCPSFIATGIQAAALDGDGQPVRHAQATVGRVATPERIADQILAAATADQRLLVPSLTARAARLLHQLAPALYERLMSRSVRAEVRR